MILLFVLEKVHFSLGKIGFGSSCCKMLSSHFLHSMFMLLGSTRYARKRRKNKDPRDSAQACHSWNRKLGLWSR